MSTIIRIKGADFNNSNLPVIPRLVGGQIKFSYKPSVENGFSDSSGAGDIPTVVGSPTLTDIGLTCGPGNGYLSSTLDNVDEITAIVVYTEISSANAFVAVGTYDSDNDQGFGLNFRSGDVTAIAFDSIGDSVSVSSDNDYDHFNGQWAALRITSDTISVFTAEGGTLVKKDVSGDFTGRAKDTSAQIGIGDTPAKLSGQDNIAEATFYQRALTDAEVLKAYEYSAAYFNKHTEISI